MSANNQPQHIAIVMDGNGRWASQRGMSRVAGHRAGVESVRKSVEYCVDKGIPYLSLFAFSSENWSRPKKEVDFLMDLFLLMLKREVQKLHKNNIRFVVMGDRAAFTDKLQRSIAKAEQLTANNTGLTLIIAANYGGCWDVTQACKNLCEQVAAGTLDPTAVNFETLQRQLASNPFPDPDLFIRTSGEHRISNFYLMQLAYAELYFTNVLWPDFNEACLDAALDSFAKRERRYGGLQIGELAQSA